MHSLLATLVLAMGLLQAAPAQAQWMWRDAAGKPVLSDRPPPPEVPDSSIVRRPGSATPKPSATDPAAGPADAAAPAPAGHGEDPVLQQRRQQAEAEQAARRQAEQQAQARARSENCARARQAKANLDSGMRVARVNAQGEREFLDDAARAAQARRAAEVMARDCAPQAQ